MGDASKAGRRLSTWRRALLAFGPGPAAKRVGLAMAEFAWPDREDGDLIVRYCTQKILCLLCDYAQPRGLRLQLRTLESSGWIRRDGGPTGPKMHREYRLLVPASVPPEVIEELSTPTRGMWRRVLDRKEITGEIQFPRYPIESGPAEQVNSSTSDPISPEVQRNNTGTAAQKQGNSDSPLKEITSSSLGVLPKGGDHVPRSLNGQSRKPDEHSSPGPSLGTMRRTEQASKKKRRPLPQRRVSDDEMRRKYPHLTVWQDHND